MLLVILATQRLHFVFVFSGLCCIEAYLEVKTVFFIKRYILIFFMLLCKIKNRVIKLHDTCISKRIWLSGTSCISVFECVHVSVEL